MDKRKDPLEVDIKKILLEMRKYRMGLIQTPDQLRFSYMAVLEGAKYIMGDSSVQACHHQYFKQNHQKLVPGLDLLCLCLWLFYGCVQKQWRELSREDQEPLSESPPPPQPPKCTERYNGSKLSRLEDGMDSKTSKKTVLETPNKEPDRDARTMYVTRRCIFLI